MIIVKLLGGIGNQMFQYACGRRLAHVHQTEIKLDLSWFSTQEKRKYYLGAFPIQEKLASPDEINALIWKKTGAFEHRIRNIFRLPSRPAPTYIREKHFHFDPDILSLGGQAYLEGYWQSEKYFLDIGDIIRKEFALETIPGGKNQELEDTIKSCHSVSIHIRRGDYSSDAETSNIHGICGPDYYQHCLGHISQSVPSPHFFIFSDDPEWSRANLKISFPATFVMHNDPDQGQADLQLMSQCRHNIISNSSFSWWGAWLNPNPRKIVLAPAQWFKSPEFDPKDLIPDGWIKL